MTQLVSPSKSILDPDLSRLASVTMDKFSHCAELGFAPCQYRIGFWLTSAEDSVKDGLDVLMHPIKVTLADKCYQGILNGSVIEAAKEIVMKGDLVGIDSIVRQEYFTLMKDQIQLVQRGQGLTDDAAKSAEQFIEPIMKFMQTRQ